MMCKRSKPLNGVVCVEIDCWEVGFIWTTEVILKHHPHPRPRLHLSFPLQAIAVYGHPSPHVLSTPPSLKGRCYTNHPT
eukprot:m.111748 g.111748  ORF g.111748 m.111748 type:complete len:79 (-) comp15390_c1_seq2:195-431(-)